MGKENDNITSKKVWKRYQRHLSQWCELTEKAEIQTKLISHFQFWTFLYGLSKNWRKNKDTEIEWKQNGHFEEKSLIFTAFWFEIIKVKTPKFFPVG